MPRKPTSYANHPIVKYVRSLPGEFYLGREVEEMLGCSHRTLVNLRRKADIPLGPTHHAAYGSTPLHLYTPERVAQIEQYMQEQSGEILGYAKPGPTRLWTRSETHIRRRSFDRARTYRNRAKIYRQQGKTRQADELVRRATIMAAKLEQDRIKRERDLRPHRKKRPTPPSPVTPPIPIPSEKDRAEISA